ncbi:MAG: Uma2 family endonuclease [Myxococcales bacterium]|nr:Uma2 family endonuclease [Myxococcales bacterium]
MTSSAVEPRDTGQLPPFPVRRFTVDEYHRLGAAGVLGEDDGVELLEGWIVPKMVHNPPHDNAVELADEALRPWLPPGWRVRIQSAIRALDSEPEPDLAVVRGSARGRHGRHPEPDEVALVVEVADTSLERDRGAKARIYARAAIPCYWIVNLVDRQVEVHEDPSGTDRDAGYRRRAVHMPGQPLSLCLGDATVSLDPADLLP